jgi:hypothetical protein
VIKIVKNAIFGPYCLQILDFFTTILTHLSQQLTKIGQNLPIFHPNYKTKEQVVCLVVLAFNGNAQQHSSSAATAHHGLVLQAVQSGHTRLPAPAERPDIVPILGDFW